MEQVGWEGKGWVEGRSCEEQESRAVWGAGEKGCRAQGRGDALCPSPGTGSYRWNTGHGNGSAVGMGTSPLTGGAA